MSLRKNRKWYKRRLQRKRREKYQTQIKDRKLLYQKLKPYKDRNGKCMVWLIWNIGYSLKIYINPWIAMYEIQKLAKYHTCYYRQSYTPQYIMDEDKRDIIHLFG